MKFINRCVVTLKPKKAFIAWVKSLLQCELPEDWAFEGGSYLMDEKDSEEALLTEIKRMAPSILTNECTIWTEDQALWPEQQDYPQLVQWFHLHITVAAFDLGNESLLRVDLSDISFT